MSGWADRNYHGFPKSVVAQAKRELPRHCAHCELDDIPLQLDHIINYAVSQRHDIGNAQWLCIPCHTAKTKHEAAEGRARHSRRRPLEPHPLTTHLGGCPSTRPLRTS